MSTEILSLVNPGIKNLKPYIPGKPIEELRRELGISDIIKLASNENPLGASSIVAERLLGMLGELGLYPDGSGYILKHAIENYRGVRAEHIVLGNGSDEIFTNVLRTFATSEHEVIISQYGFAAYAIAVHSLGIKLKEVEATNWGHDLDKMAKAITAKTRVIFLANPNNPTGTYFDRGSLVKFMQQVPSTVIVVLDQAYFEYAQAGTTTLDTDYPDGVELLERYPNLVVTHTFSKAYGLAGLRIGYAIANATIVDMLNRIRLPFNVNALGLCAAAVALTDQQHIKQTINNNLLGMRQYEQAFKAMGLNYIPSIGNFITVDLGRAAEPVFQAMLRLGVIVRPLLPYNMPNHLRITVGLEPENTRCLAALSKVLGLKV